MLILVVVFLLLNALDVLLSLVLRAHGGFELNPLLRGENWVWIKLPLVVIVTIVVCYLGRERILMGLVVGMLLVVSWNLIMLGLIGR